MFVPFGGIANDLSLYEKNIMWKLNNNTCGGVGPGFTASEISEYLLKQTQTVGDRLQVLHIDHWSK